MICGSRSRREVLVSSPLCRSLSDIFFCVFLSHRSFRFRCFSKATRLEIQGFSDKILPKRSAVWRFFRKPQVDLLFPKPAAIPLHLNATIDAKGKTKWRKENQSGK